MTGQPLYFLVGCRPVVILETIDGGMDCQVYDWQSGAFEPDPAYISRCIGPNPSEAAEPITVEAFFLEVVQLRRDLDLPPAFTDWARALQAFLCTLAEPSYTGWTPTVGEASPLTAWHDDRHRDGTPIRMDSDDRSHSQCHATVQWAKARMRLSRYDSDLGDADADECPIPPNWLAAMQRVSWPVTGERPIL